MYHLFHLSQNSTQSLQSQLREQIAAAIINGHIPPNIALPSSRKLSRQLNIARNTVVLAYEHLLDNGYLIARQRSGYYVNPEILKGRARAQTAASIAVAANQPDWQSKLKIAPTKQHNIDKPRDWQTYPYPFIYGQFDPKLFPTNHWRECCRDAGSVQSIRDWAADRFDGDDPLLIEQIHTRLLPRRGVWADPEQILVTVGAQQALYLLARLLLDDNSVIGLEDPGYVDIRNIATLNPSKVKALRIDDQGLIVDDQIDECDYIFVTPSHQSPTTVTMPIERRYELLERAAKSDVIIIEDDYESETNFRSEPVPALKSLDDNERVLYLGSLSKTLAPGLRLGYLVGPRALIKEVRALRRLMLRHPAANNQRSVALFLARGYHDSLVCNLVRAYKQRSKTMGDALNRYLPASFRVPSFGGSSYWVCGPQGLDSQRLKQRAAQQGILIEPGDIYFLSDNPPRNYLRLAYSSIADERIEKGIRMLAQLIDDIL